MYLKRGQNPLGLQESQDIRWGVVPWGTWGMKKPPIAGRHEMENT